MRGRSPSPALLCALLLVPWASGCMPASTGTAGAPPGAGTATAPTDRGAALPGGFGSLRMQDISIDLAIGGLQLRVTPLSDQITALAAPDTWERLAATRRGVTRPATVFLVAVDTEEPGGVDFDPLDIQLLSQGTVRRAEEIRGLTPAWGAGPLEQRRPQQALYLFSPSVDPNEDWAIQVGGVRSVSWATRIPRLEAERARVRARAGGWPQSSSRSNFLIFR